MNVRSKLIAILIVPLLVVAVMAMSGIRERRADRDSAADAEQLVALGRAVTPLADALEREADASSSWLAVHTDAEHEALQQRRVATDEAVADLQVALSDFPDGLADEGLLQALRPVRSGLGVVGVNRTTVDAGGAGATGAMRVYRQQASQLLDVVEEIAHEIDDAALSRRATAWLAVSRTRQAANSQHTVLAQALRPGSADASQGAELHSLEADRRVGEGLFSAVATDDQKELWRVWVGGNDAQAAAAQRDVVMSILDSSPTGAVDGGAIASEAYVDALRTVEGDMGADLSARAEQARSGAERDVRAYAVLAAGAVLFSMLAAFMVGRSITRPLRRLTRAARHVADVQLPALVDTLRTPRAAEGQEMTPIERTSSDEIGDVAEAFGQIQRVTATVAAEQAQLLRKGIGDLFVNLARRNQSLLDRQINFLDELEANETDPEDLEHLFKLDHLATRMRRNAESLLVLAGVETPRRWGRPVPVGDVIRAAISEVEDYGRITVTGLDDVRIPGAAAADVAHLFAELLDNATQFSPPGSPVEVSGSHRDEHGEEYVVRIADAGIGMTAAQLAEANQTLSEPPLTGLALSRSLGFTVVSRLAARYGIDVRVTSTPGGGVATIACLPSTLMVADGDGSVASLEPDGVATGPGAGPRVGPKGWSRPTDVPAAVWERITEAPSASWGPLPELAEPTAGGGVHETGTPEPDEAAAPLVTTASADAWDDAPATLAEALPEPPSTPEAEPVVGWIGTGSVARDVAPATTATGLPRRRGAATGDPLLAVPAPAAAAPAPAATTAPAPAPAERPATTRPAGTAKAPAAATRRPAAGATGRPARPSMVPEPAAAPARSNRPGPIAADGLPRRVARAGASAAPAPAGVPGATASARTPEEIRSMLSAYRNGLARGRQPEGGGTSAPRTDPSTDVPGQEG